METKPLRVGIYARISEDRDGQQGAAGRLVPEWSVKEGLEAPGRA